MTSFELFVALRYLLARRKQAFISLISLISVIGVAVGVMALLIALALMTGLQGELRDRLVGSAAHVYVPKVGGIQDPAADIRKLTTVPHVVAAAPVILGKGMLRSERGEAFIDVKGIDVEGEKTVTHLQQAMRKGTIDALTPGTGDQPGMLIGSGLAAGLEVEVGDTVQLLTAKGDLTPLGNMF